MILKERIKKEICGKTGKLKSIIISKPEFKDTEIYRDIINATSFLPEDRSLSERVFCINNNITSLPLCPITNKPLKFLHSKKRYAKCTGQSNSYNIIDRNKKNNNLSKNKINNNKSYKENLLNKYRSQNYTLIDKEDVIDFIDKRILKTDKGRNHQFINIGHIRSDIDMLCSIMHYTKFLPIDENVNWSERFFCIKNNIQSKNKCLYCNNPTTYINYIKNYNQVCNSRECISRLGGRNRHNKLKEIIIDNITNAGYTILSFPDRLDKELIKLKCNKCEHTFETIISCGRGHKRIRCKGCEPSSKYEIEIQQFLQSNDISFDANVRNIIPPRELDIYIKQSNVAIEFNGVYWHSDEYVDKNYHYQKTEKCKERNIELIHIFEHQWEYKSEICKSIILNKLNKTANRIYARKCDVREINSKQKNEFLERNHMQGKDSSKIKLGLFHNDELVSVMTFGIPRFNKNYEWELIRFCNSINVSVIGGASKIFKYFEKNYNPSSIISYCDLSRYSGNLYFNLGFKLKENTSPNYMWLHPQNNIIVPRYKSQKHKLKSLLGDQYDPNLSEAQNMKNSKFVRIYDCGNAVFIKENIV